MSILTIEQCKELMALNVDMSKATCHYIHRDCDDPQFVESTWHEEDDIYTFTLSDILKMLPKPCYLNCLDDDFYQCEVITNTGNISVSGNSPINAAFNMIKHLTEFNNENMTGNIKRIS